MAPITKMEIWDTWKFVTKQNTKLGVNPILQQTYEYPNCNKDQGIKTSPYHKKMDIRIPTYYVLDIIVN
jgi:hypothetical protein